MSLRFWIAIFILGRFFCHAEFSDFLAVNSIFKLFPSDNVDLAFIDIPPMRRSTEIANGQFRNINYFRHLMIDNLDRIPHGERFHLDEESISNFYHQENIFDTLLPMIKRVGKLSWNSSFLEDHFRFSISANWQKDQGRTENRFKRLVDSEGLGELVIQGLTFRIKLEF